MSSYQIVVFISLVSVLSGVFCGPEEDVGVRYANRCEACKILATELEARLQETGKTHDVLQLGYSLDDVKPKKKKEYRYSELRLLESLENICDRILEYNIHKEREDSTRFAKGTSMTFQTLQGLVDKGVKVDLGIPHELWNKPSAEITNMKTQCEKMVEQYEEVIDTWYKEVQTDVPLMKYLCEERVLADEDSTCLYEVFKPKDKKDKKEKKEKKGDKEEL